MQTIPLKPLPNQTLTIGLAGQTVKLRVYQKFYGLFVDVYVNDVLIIGGVLALNQNKIIRDSYLGFIGDLGFIDNQGNNDPVYTGLGSRFTFVYLEASDL